MTSPEYFACKAKNRWSSFEPKELDGPDDKQIARARMTNQEPEDADVML